VTNGFINAYIITENKEKLPEQENNDIEPQKEKEKVQDKVELPAKKLKREKIEKPKEPKGVPIIISPAAHKLTIETIPSRFSEESFQVYNKYQATIHKESKEKTPEGYINFLVTSPLRFIPPEKDSPVGFPGYGSFHQEYRIDGKLFMVGVIDILPKCISSVYLYYDPEYIFLSPGILSALKEIEWVKTCCIPYSKDLQYYYMGFYIHSCVKMRYKGGYHPSDLLCPESYTWHPLSAVEPLLDKTKYTRFAEPPIPMDEKDLQRLMNQIPMEYEKRIIYIRDLTSSGKRIVSEKFREYIPLIGPNLATKLVYFLR